MGLLSRYKSHCPVPVSHSLLQLPLTAASPRDFKSESKKPKETKMKLQHYLPWALWGAHRFNRGQGRTRGQLEQSKPKAGKAERKEQLSGSLCPCGVERGGRAWLGSLRTPSWRAKRGRTRESATEGLPCLFSGFMNLADRKERSILVEVKVSLFIVGQLDYLTFKGPCQPKLVYDSVKTVFKHEGEKQCTSMWLGPLFGIPTSPACV